MSSRSTPARQRRVAEGSLTAELRGEAWPAADQLFHSDPRWLGGDDAYSVPLAPGRTLWLFGDSFVSNDKPADRGECVFVRNSVAIQEGADPSAASIAFHWGATDGGQPASFFGEEARDWFWPGDGVRLGNVVVVFLMRVRSPKRGLGSLAAWARFGALGFFDVYDWDARLIENPDDEPSQWRVRRPQRPAGNAGIVAGSAGVVVIDNHLYGYGFGIRDRASLGGGRPVYLWRWKIDQAAAGDLSQAEVWSKDRNQGAVWKAVDEGSPAPVLQDGQTEFSVHVDPHHRRLLQVQAIGVEGAFLAARWADLPQGPWSPLQPIFSPEEASRKDGWIYAGKAHPELSGADVVLTYASNAWKVERVMVDQTLYYPRFVKATVPA